MDPGLSKGNSREWGVPSQDSASRKVRPILMVYCPQMGLLCLRAVNMRSAAGEVRRHWKGKCTLLRNKSLP